MKFLCENCKAKYQIADDKVAGRTVRMKCRKCGHMIEVEASVTETSVATKMPPPEDGARPAATGVSAPKGAVQAAAMGLPPPRPPAAPPRAASALAPGAMIPPPAPAGRPSAPKPAPRPPPPAPSAGLAGAFSKAVVLPQDDPSSVSAAMAVLSSNASTEEWYVGINGVPVGPVRLSELRRKASAGLINDESLVWREGFEEWVPLRTFPELSAMLKESSTARTSLTPIPPTGGGTFSSILPGAPALARTNGALTSGAARTQPPRNAIASTGRSNVVAIASRRATAEKIEGLSELEEEIRFESQPPPAGISKAEPAPPAPLASPLAASEVSASANAPVAATAAVVAPEQHRLSGFSRMAKSRRAHPAAWIVVALGGMLIGVGAMVFLLPKADKPAVQIVSVMVPTPPPPTPSPAASSEVTTIESIEVGVATPTKPSSGSGGKSTKAVAEPATTATAAPLSTSLSGLGGLVNGPSGPSGQTAPGGGGQPLAAADIERVVQGHRAFVKRQCWETALAGRSPNSPSSARVVASMSIASDGHVASSSASGGEAFPGLAMCVQNQVKSWKFPPSDGTTPVSVPFVFAAQ